MSAEDTAEIIEKLWQRKEWRYTYSNAGAGAGGSSSSDAWYLADDDDDEYASEYASESESEEVSEQDTVSEASSDFTCDSSEPYRAQYYHVEHPYRQNTATPSDRAVVHREREGQRLPWRTNAQCQTLVEEAVQVRISDSPQESKQKVKQKRGRGCDLVQLGMVAFALMWIVGIYFLTLRK